MKLNHSKTPLHWTANWIHGNLTGQGPHYILFRKTFSVDNPLSRAIVHITADRYYKLYVDGRLAGEGPLRSNVDYWSYDSIDLTGSLRTGQHAIAVLVMQWSPDPGNPLALLLQCEMENSHGQQTGLFSDVSWKYTVSRQWRSDMPPQVWCGPIQNGYVEYRDLRKEPNGWTDAAYDDSHWENAHVFTRNDIGRDRESRQPIRVFGAKWEWLVSRDLLYFTGSLISPQRICAWGEIQGSEIYWKKEIYDPQWWAGLEDLLPLAHSAIRSTDRLLAGSGKPVEFTVRYEGRSFGRMIWQPAVIIDFGKLLNGYIQLDVDADSGLMLDMTYAQDLSQGKVLPCSGGIMRYNRYVLREGRQQIETIGWHNLRYLQLTVRGDAGVGLASRMNLYSVAVRTVEYPTAAEGCFSCSDSLLTRIWEATLHTTRLCMLDVMMDETYRERQGWSGDITQMVLSALTCFGHVAVIPRYLQMFIREQLSSGAIPVIVPSRSRLGFNGIFDHPMAIPMRIVDYYEYSGDDVFLRRNYPGLRRYMVFIEKYETESGTLDEVPGWLWFDHANLDHRLPSVLLNLYYLLLLEYMAKAASYAGYPEDAIVYQAKARSIRSFSVRWTLASGAYPDSLAADDMPPSEHTNALALLCAADACRSTAIIDSVFSGGFDINKDTDVIPCGPPFALYALQGLCQAGRYDLACAYMRQRHGLAVEQGLGTMPESWIFFANGETSAAQGTLAAAYILTREILGIKPLRPGFKSILFQPHPGDLRWAKGELLSPYGKIKAEWTLADDGFSMDVDIPSGTTGTIQLPGTEHHAPCCNTAEEIRFIDGQWNVHLDQGTHGIKLTANPF